MRAYILKLEAGKKLINHEIALLAPFPSKNGVADTSSGSQLSLII